MWETYIPLLTYVHPGGSAGTKMVPGLARGMPKIGDGGRTYTLYLREGLRYSDGSPVRASDFPATIERVLEMNSPGTPFYTESEHRPRLTGRRSAGGGESRQRQRRSRGLAAALRLVLMPNLMPKCLKRRRKHRTSR
jgi:peptide/nickel transport system substrate-binding protein